LLEINIKKTLPGFQLDIDLSVNREIISMLGPSGSGKTMTLLSIAGLLKPDQGIICLNGCTLFSSQDNIFLPPQKRKIGFVFQNYALFPHMTVADNIAYGMQGKPKEQIKKRVDDLLEIIHIPALKNRYPFELSSGQQQRVALARAIAPEPEALLLDEPFSALDTFRKERLEFELLTLQQYYLGDILFVTHDLTQGFKLGTRLAIYDNGRIVQCDNREEVISSPVNRTAARLTGVKNLFDGIVTGSDNHSAIIYIPEFGTSLKTTDYSAAKLYVDQMVVLGIRPEHIEIFEEPTENTIPCREGHQVVGVTNIHYYYYAERDNNKRYHLESCRPRPLLPPCFEAGKPCYLYFPPERIITLVN